MVAQTFDARTRCRSAHGAALPPGAEVTRAPPVGVVRRPAVAQPDAGARGHRPTGPETRVALTCDDQHVHPPTPRGDEDRARLAERVGESLTRLARVTGELTTADSLDAVS